MLTTAYSFGTLSLPISVKLILKDKADDAKLSFNLLKGLCLLVCLIVFFVFLSVCLFFLTWTDSTLALEYLSFLPKRHIHFKHKPLYFRLKKV